MASSRFLKLLCTFILLLTVTFLFAKDGQEVQPDDDLPLLLVFGFYILCIGAALFVAGSLLGITLLVITGLLIAVGILSSSVLIALYKKSWLAGFRTFLFLSLSFAGGISGALTGWGLGKIFHFSMSDRSAALIGALGGVAAGLLLTAVILLITKKLGKMLSLS